MNEFRIRIRRVFRKYWVLMLGVLAFFFLILCNKKIKSSLNGIEWQLSDIESKLSDLEDRLSDVESNQ